MIHVSCYDFCCLTNHKLNHFSTEDPEAAACGKRYHDSTVKDVNQSSLLYENRNLAWDRDGKHGPHDPINSEFLVVNFVSD